MSVFLSQTALHVHHHPLANSQIVHIIRKTLVHKNRWHVRLHCLCSNIPLYVFRLHLCERGSLDTFEWTWFFCDGGYEKCFLPMTVYHEDKMIKIDHLLLSSKKGGKLWTFWYLQFGFFMGSKQYQNNVYSTALIYNSFWIIINHYYLLKY